ncbi:sce7725 family protein [Paenibacillus albidus]|uniref:sce7725 family protein n=1 Tax=Paenibacillus albidus TaxID=2041023 RepID=UPI001BEC3F3A|nr:sce7725 family protein [Paenibacillus albidus]MBT2289251.1 sce7725 family protein [Paenibacillus albidus]
MYFPYLRAKQFELIALRELVEKDLIGRNILPIIEPVKFSSTLTKTIEHYCLEDRFIGVIRNPKVGNFLHEIENVNNDKSVEKFVELMEGQNVLSSLITSDNSVGELNKIIEEGISKDNIILIHNNREFLDNYSVTFTDSSPKYNLIPDQSAYRRTAGQNRVLFNDKFAKKSSNKDYSKVEDEFFSDDHLYYAGEGYKGFSDYSIVGADYNESGFAPYAVAIHIVYFDDKKILRIRHFVSNSNQDIKDPAGKFGEALEKLVEWNKKQRLTTYGIMQFVQHHENGTYPGLGTVKKLSLMHHIELMSNYLDEVN